jgi:HEAT repeat protein
VDARLYAAEQLGLYGAADVLIQGLEVNKNTPEVVIAIVKNLGNLRSNRTVPVLIKTAEGDTSEEVNNAVLDALYSIGDTSALKFFRKTLSHSNSLLRDRAAYALGDFLAGKMDSAAIRSLSEAYKIEKDAKVRVTMVNALGKIDGRLTVPVMIYALGDSNPVVRELAASFLGELGDVSAVKPLIQLLGDKSSIECQKEAADALWQIGDPAAFPAMISALDNKWEVRQHVYELLTNTRDRQIILFLVDSLASKSTAITADIEKLLPEQYNRFGAAAIKTLDEALQKTKDPALQARIITFLGDLHYTVASHSAMATTVLNRVLEDLTKYSSSSLRIAAADALSKVGYPFALPTLKEALRRDPDVSVRRRAVMALHKIGVDAPQGTREIVFILDVYGLGDREVSVIIETIRALGALGDPQSLSHLRSIEASEHYSPSVREEARQAINKIESRSRS